MLRLNIYKNQNEIEKTFEVDGYDIMYGTVEDILQVLDDVGDLKDEVRVLQAVNKHRSKLNDLIFDIFPDMTQEDIRKVKVRELVPFFIDLFGFVKNSFAANEKN